MIHLAPTKNSWFPGEPLSNKRSDSRIVFFILLACSMILILVFAAIYFTRIQTIIASPLVPKSSYAYVAGRSLIFLNTAYEQHVMLEHSPATQTISLKKIFPQTLVITATRAIPIAQLVNKPGYLNLSLGGKIIENTPKINENLIPISYFQHLRSFEIKPGTTITVLEIQKALEVVTNTPRLPLSLQKIMITQPGELVLSFDNSKLTVTLGTKKDIAKILFILHNIVKGLERKGIVPSSINLKFDKPLITI
jgi:hypothetical protein